MHKPTHTSTTRRGGCRRVAAIVFAMMLVSGEACGRNIRVSNVRCTEHPGAAGQSDVQFDLAWEDSWRSESVEPAEINVTGKALPVNNWDAAWVFVKFRATGSADGYSHARLSPKAVDHVLAAGAAASVGLTDDRGVGVFVYRAEAGRGKNDWKGLSVRWLHGADGVAAVAAVDIKVYAIEMVYVDQGAFAVGNTGPELNALNLTVITQKDPTAAGGRPTGSTEPDSPAWPNGYAAFYCMKQEVTQGEYAAFLNALPRDACGRTASLTDSSSRYYAPAASVSRYSLTGDWPNIAASKPGVACNFLSWFDGVKYAAWAGLRPMTEIEFEKACRGPLNPVPGEYAWGTADIAGTDFPVPSTDGYALQSDGGPDESVTWVGANGPGGSVGNAVWSGTVRRENDAMFAVNAINGPLHAGIFAKPGNTRVLSGASYWGILELSGNLYERVVTIGNRQGRGFQGSHGTGTVSVPLDWPSSSADGTGLRGGSWFSWDLRVSERNAASLRVPERKAETGMRAVRTAP
jgi:formylglycine-generating enzyme required for sulfatase activity